MMTERHCELPVQTPDRCFGALQPAELALHQPIPFGTTAWRISMGRRQVVESVNAALKGSFVDLARGFFRVFGRVKMTVLLGFTVAAFNIDRVRSFRSKHHLEADGSPSGASHCPSPRAKRRIGTWDQVVEKRSKPPPG
jgi:hypothetical protein